MIDPRLAMLERIISKLEELGYLDESSTYEEFECVMNNMIRLAEYAREGNQVKPGQKGRLG